MGIGIDDSWSHSLEQKIHISEAFILVQALDGIVILFMVFILFLLEKFVLFFGSTKEFGLNYLIEYSHPVYIGLYLLIGLINIADLYDLRRKKIDFRNELFYTFEVIIDLIKDLIAITATLIIIVILLRVVTYANVSSEYWINALLQLASTLYVLAFVIIGFKEIFETIGKKFDERHRKSSEWRRS